MRKIKRLQLDIEFDDGNLRVFHTGFKDNSGDPPTVIEINGREFNGQVSFIQIGDDYNIRIQKRRKV